MRASKRVPWANGPQREHALYAAIVEQLFWARSFPSSEPGFPAAADTVMSEIAAMGALLLLTSRPTEGL